MKKILTLVIFTFSFFNGFSQTLNYGVGAGLNYNSLIISNFGDENPKYKLGFQVNAVIGYNINDKFGLRIEPGFANRGTILSYPGQSDSKININYITIPILFKYSPIDKFSILLGPECAYRLTAKSTADGNTTDLKSIYDSKFDFGIDAGLSYRFIDKLEIGFRYNRGFISTIKNLRFTDENGNDKGKARLCNQGFTFSIIYMIK
jgi:opacity protein-like surface antigen